MKILLPIAGPDTAFQQQGFPFSKNLVEIQRKPLIQHVIENLSTIAGARFIFVINKEEDARFHIGSVLRLLQPDSDVVVAEKPTSGAACTALLAIEKISRDEPLIIANGDQIIRADLAKVVEIFREKQWDGGAAIFNAVHPRWSYVRLDSEGLVVEAAEKRPISNHATAGFYYFRRGADFIEAAMSTIRKDAHVDGNFYICPAFNEMILKQAKIGAVRIPQDAYFKLSTPQGVQEYESFLRGPGSKATAGHEGEA